MGGQGRTPLFRACADGDFRIVRILLESVHFKGDEKKQKEYINRKNNPLYQHTPFYMASWRGFLDIMQYLEELYADIDCQCANLLRPSDAARPYVKPFFDLIQFDFSQSEKAVRMSVDNPQWPNDTCLDVLRGADGFYELWFAMNEGQSVVYPPYSVHRSDPNPNNHLMIPSSYVTHQPLSHYTCHHFWNRQFLIETIEEIVVNVRFKRLHEKRQCEYQQRQKRGRKER